MRIAMISDIHGNLDFKVPEADLLLIAGDLCPAYYSPTTSVYIQQHWLDTYFRQWLSQQPIKEIIVTSGNHDWIWEKYPNRVPKLNDNFHYIEDESIDILGLKIYGTPVQLPFNDWAFNRDEDSIRKYWDNIPEGLDILLLHSPPYGIMDMTGEGIHIGSKSLKKRIEKVTPKIVVFGHNHAESGIIEENGIKYINASLLNEKYIMNKKPILIDL